MRWGDIRARLHGLPDNQEVRFVVNGAELMPDCAIRKDDDGAFRFITGADLPVPVEVEEPEADPAAPRDVTQAPEPVVDGAVVEGAPAKRRKAKAAE